MFDLLLYQLRTTQYVNSKTFDDKGICIFYSKTALTFSLLKNIGLIAAAIYLFMLYDINIYILLFCAMLIFVAILSSMTDVIPRLLYKNPIFIISDNSLFCTKNDTTYDLTISHFIKYKPWRQILFSHIRIQRQDKTKQFNEDLYWINNVKSLSNHICQVKGIHRLPNNMDVPEDFYDLTKM